jgi:Domain of unknown function (DUF4337)
LAEVEIPHPHQVDEFGKRVGVLVGGLGVLLSVVTIASHREHTRAVVLRTEANDQWSFYQAKKIREYQAEVGTTLLQVLRKDADQTTAATALQTLSAQHSKLANDAADLKRSAELRDDDTHRAEARALRLDLGEGFLQLGLVLCSMYFLARRRLFPGMGVAAAALGVVIAASALAV